MAKRAHDPTPQTREIFRQVVVLGIPPTEVAQKFGLRRQSVYKAVARMRAYLHQHLLSGSQAKFPLAQMHLERLELQWQEAINAWFRSQEEAETTKTSRDGANADNEKIEHTTRSTTGDVRYLQLAQRLLCEIRALVDGPSAADLPLEVKPDEPDLTAEQRRQRVYRQMGLNRFGRRPGSDAPADRGEEHPPLE